MSDSHTVQFRAEKELWSQFQSATIALDVVPSAVLRDYMRAFVRENDRGLDILDKAEQEIRATIGGREIPRPQQTTDARRSGRELWLEQPR